MPPRAFPTTRCYFLSKYMIRYINCFITGHHDLSLDIKGVGFLASMLRSLAHNFVVKRRIEKVTTNRGTAYYSPSSIAWKLEIPSIFRVIYFLLAHVMHLTISIYSSYGIQSNNILDFTSIHERTVKRYIYVSSR